MKLWNCLTEPTINYWCSSQFHSKVPVSIVPHPRTANFKSQKVITDFRPLSFSHSWQYQESRSSSQFNTSVEITKLSYSGCWFCREANEGGSLEGKKKEDLQTVLILLFVQIKWAVQHGQGTTTIPLCFPLLCATYRTLGVGCLRWTWTTVSQTVTMFWISKRL